MLHHLICMIWYACIYQKFKCTLNTKWSVYVCCLVMFQRATGRIFSDPCNPLLLLLITVIVPQSIGAEGSRAPLAFWGFSASCKGHVSIHSFCMAPNASRAKVSSAHKNIRAPLGFGGLKQVTLFNIQYHSTTGMLGTLICIMSLSPSTFLHVKSP